MAPEVQVNFICELQQEVQHVETYWSLYAEGAKRGVLENKRAP